MKINKKQLPLVVIFGRTNAGKSTLFNCLTEKKQALVSEIEGTTRDSNLKEIEWRGKKLILVDTGGILDLKYLFGKNLKSNDIESKVQNQARQYLQRADLILFLVDTKSGLLPQDKQMALFLKKNLAEKNKIILVANKVDSPKYIYNLAEFNKLSLGEPIAISAANGSGTGDLLDVIIKKLKKIKIGVQIAKGNKTIVNLQSAYWQGGSTIDNKINVCLIGKPNIGKSSLLNSILGYERVIVSETPHTTREPQNTEIIYDEKFFTLVDTAGISRKGQKIKNLTKDGIFKSFGALNQADIALFLIDVSQKITRDDLRLVQEIIDRKKSFIIIANKWDLINEKDTKHYTEYIYSKFPFASWAPIHFTSALTGAKVDKIFNLIIALDMERKKQLSDSQLNKFLNKIVKIHPPTKGKGFKHPHIYELKQISSSPPNFNLRIGTNDDLHFSYVRFIENRLREKFGFSGTPITIKIIK
ncbi:MAG: ribosome biogenesis GTPase Der [Patescibacteria group bacterium]